MFIKDFKNDKLGFILYYLIFLVGFGLFVTLPVFTYRTGYNVITNVVSILFCALVLIFLLYKGNFIFDPFICPFIILCFYSIVSWAITRYSSLTVRSTITLYALLFFVYEFVINTKSSVKFIYFLVFGNVLLFIFIFVDNLDLFLSLNLERLGAEFGNLNTIGLSFSVGMLLACFLTFHFKRKWLKFCCWILFFIFAIFMFLTESRGAILVGFLSCLLLMFFYFNGKKRIWLILSLVLLSALFIGILQIPYFLPLKERLIGILVTIFSGGESSAGTANGRLFMLQEGIYLWLQSPLFGHGPDAFTYISDFAVYSHASIADVLCNQGLLGMFLWLFPGFYICFKADKAYRPISFAFFFGLILPGIFFYILTTSKIAMPAYIIVFSYARENLKIGFLDFSFSKFRPHLFFYPKGEISIGRKLF